MRRQTSLLLVVILAAACASTTPPPADASQGQPTPKPGEPAGPAPPLTSNTIKWRTASENNVFGYDVFRGESPDGPFTRANKKTVLGHGTTTEPHEYVYVDEGVNPSKTYYYYVESITRGAKRAVFTPLLKKEPKDQQRDGAPQTQP